MLDKTDDRVWTEVRVEQLKRLQAQQLSAREIMLELPDARITRNSVIGKLKRLGLRCQSRDEPKRDKPPRRHQTPIMDRRIKLPAQGRPERPAILAVPFEPRRSEPKPPTVTADQEGSTEHRCTLFDLTNATCRWPLGPMQSHVEFYCGVPDADVSEKRPYCAFHMRKAYGRSVAA